jgi:molecular chaperone GrpE
MKMENSGQKSLEDVEKELLAAKQTAEELDGKLDVEKAKADEYKSILQQLQADFENQVKRSSAERQDVVRCATKDLVMNLLPVVDTMDLALSAKPKDQDCAKMLDGFRRVSQQLKGVLAQEGLAEIPSDGRFNHDLQEAVDTVEDKSKPDGTIAEVIQRGYTLNGKLIRTAKVTVVKNRGECNG